MYALLLALHNLTRWIVLVTAIWAIVQVIRGWGRSAPWSAEDRRASLAFVTALDVQVLFGLILYFVSPLVRAAMSDMGAAMADADLRFFFAEHATIMVIAVILAHIGSAVGRRATADNPPHRKVAIFYALSLLAILFAIPWWRPFLRGF